MKLKNPPLERRRDSAFTMVEIAISLAIIGFALVAIIGVLPVGLNVQRENREETIINQDASIFMDAIRSGARGMDYLTNYVVSISNIVTRFRPDGTIIDYHIYNYTYENWFIDNVVQDPAYEINDGFSIIGLLSTPKYVYSYLPHQVLAESNYVTAYCRAISGAASEKWPQTNVDVRELAFNYRITAEVVPYVNWDTNWVDYNAPGLTLDEINGRSNYWRVASITHTNLRDVRLIFRWPLLGNGRLGNGRQTFRTTAGGILSNDPPGSVTWFVQPQSYF